jgi:hypothetical protein
MTFPHKNGSSYDGAILALVLLPLVWIFILVRIYVRGFLTKKPGWDDITVVLAAVSLCPKTSDDLIWVLKIT